MMRKLIFTLLFLLLLASCGQVGVAPEVAVTETAVPEAASAEATVMPEPTAVTGVTILADGVVKAERPVLPLGFRANGQLLTIAVQPGDDVAAGDVLATLDDAALQEAIANADLQLEQSQASLKQAQAELGKLLAWKPDVLAVELAQANLAAAEAGLESTQTQDSVAGNSVTSARIAVDQAERGLADAQKAYDTAYDPGREWELNDRWRADALKNEREAATRNLKFAQENLETARANYVLAAAKLNDNSVLSAEAAVINARQALAQAQKGPTEAEIEAARLNVEKAEIALRQSELALEQVQDNLSDAQLIAPWNGRILSVDVAPGAFVSAGAPVLQLLDMDSLAFYTTNLSERDLAQVGVGDTAVITLKAYPDDPIKGTVARIGLQAEGTVGDAATFPVIILLNNTGRDVRPGMTGRVEILGE